MKILFLALFLALAFINFGSFMENKIDNKTMKNPEPNYSKNEILNYLDSCINHPNYSFVDLGHGYFYLANSKLHLFADNTRWAIVFEKFGFENRTGTFQIELNCFGNCLTNLDKYGDEFSNTKYFNLTSSFYNEIEINQVLSAQNILIRNQNIKISNNIEDYYKHGIIEKQSEIDEAAIARLLTISNPELISATNKEITTCLPSDLPFLMEINKWYQLEYNGYMGYPEGTKPSSYETYCLIADILVSKDTTLYKPTFKANNHWKNWPLSGSL